MLNRSLIFKRAWTAYKIKIIHNCKTTLGNELKMAYFIANAIGCDNYYQK